MVKQRHKKTLKSEKSKIKLKNKPGVSKTKFLPKGANVTDVNFKIKPIVILEQLRLHTGDEPLTKRKLNLQDLLTRLNHNNTSVKCEACEGLTELIQTCPPEVIEQNLHSLLQGVCGLIKDREKKVRHKTIKLLSDIIAKVSPTKLPPFFNMLTIYALAAMTAIDQNVQEDSLLIIDAYLKHAPLLIVKSFNRILVNFLTLVSRLRNDSKIRTITVRLGSKMTSVKWRISVLKRLQGILDVMVNDSSKKAEQQTNYISFNAGEGGHIIPIYKGVGTYSFSLNGDSSVAMMDADHNIEQHVADLLPLLHETWAEVVPLNDGIDFHNGFTVIEQDAASILDCVMGIFHLLWKLVQQTADANNKKLVNQLFSCKESQRFFNHILNQFPYHQKDLQKWKGAKELQLDVNMDVKCVRENLMISYMFCVLYRTFPSLHYVHKAIAILKYLNLCLVKKNYVTAENIEILAFTLRQIFFTNFNSWTKRDMDIQELLDNVVHFHLNLGQGNYAKVKIFNLLCEVVESPALRSSKYETWLSKLPSLLCRPEISEHVVQTLSLLSRQNNELFLQAFLKELPNILGNLPLIKIIGSSSYPSHLLIVSMFSYLPLQPEHVNLLIKFISINQGTKMAMYVHEVLEEKTRMA